jgi:L-rhamnose-H+ transport protein
MNPIFGVIFHAIGGLAAGSFYAPCKKVKGWAWETYWLVLGIFAVKYAVPGTPSVEKGI